MSLPVLTPQSNISLIILPESGNASDVNNACPLKVYSDPASPLYSEQFISGAVDQVMFVYRKIGGDVLDIELTTNNVYAAYEDAVMEYSRIVNLYQARNVLSDALGSPTGSFDENGNLVSGSTVTDASTKYPNFSFGYAQKIWDGVGTKVGIGGTHPIYSASFDVIDNVQDYDLQAIVSSSAASGGVDYAGINGDERIFIKRVWYKTPRSMWRFYGYFGGINVTGNFSTYGQYADDSSFELIPAWYNKLQAAAYEDSLYTRASHYSYEIKNNKLRIFPKPVIGAAPTKMWFEFTTGVNAFEDYDGTDNGTSSGLNGVNNINNIPFQNLPYTSVNSMGKHWIRSFALAICKEMLAQIRGKFSTVPIPGESIQLNAAELTTQAKEEKDRLREELKNFFEATTYDKLLDDDAKKIDNAKKIAGGIPTGIWMI